MQMTMRRAMQVGVPVLLGLVVAWLSAEAAARMPGDGGAMGLWVLCVGALVIPSFWANAQIEHWMTSSKGEGHRAPVAAPGPFALYRGAPGHAATAGALEWPLAGQMTINDLVRLAGEIAHSKGWHEQQHPEIVSEAAYAQLAALTPVVLALGEVVRVVRRHPGDSPDVALAVKRLHLATEQLTMWRRWLVGAADDHAERVGEYGQPMAGSKTEALAHMILRVSEAAEEAQGVITGDLPNTLEEIGDQWIRAGSSLWAWAHVAAPTWAEVPHPPVLADFETVLRAKLEQNVGMAHRKGGLRA